ncbi:Protein YidD [Helicobacter fennelliae]|uniref:Protein YidD n=2 Tax=Helicobacter fennelliae TaxID=215 RepID=A0A2X3BA27_9HELI|nr:membrane protein insertion efficiency factor YidD [uncultured Helicobacter sp.]SQB97731.1 Protein YidD [Helicobacter fennelliae]STQ83553.1 Protein YidD [Helicobacter fennelliae]
MTQMAKISKAARLYNRAIAFLRYVVIVALRGYKLLLSPLLPQSCRLYPTCSHYAQLVAKYQNPLFAPFQVCYRLLLCQPFCKKYIHYPIVKLKLKATFSCPQKVTIWFVPISKKFFYTKDWVMVIPSL